MKCNPTELVPVRTNDGGAGYADPGGGQVSGQAGSRPTSGLPLWADMAAAGQDMSATGSEAKSAASTRDISSRIRGVPYDPANLIGREAATPWDRGRSYAHQRGSFDRID